VSQIESGSRIRVKEAVGAVSERRALTGVMMGEHFPVVWACRESEWLASSEAGRPAEGVPWPAEDVEAIEALP
jgi:hypothetical protein